MIPKPEPRGPKPRRPIKRKGGKRTSRCRAQRKARLKDCDRVFSLLIRTRDDWTCKACGSIKNPQCAHIVSRRYRATRWDSRNAVCLCAGCHVRFTFDPLAWDAWCQEYRGLVYQELRAQAMRGVAHVDYDAELEALKTELRLWEEHRRGK